MGMNVLPILKAIGPILDAATSIVSASCRARKETLPVTEEIKRLDAMDERQAQLIAELARQTEALGQVVAARDETIASLQPRLVSGEKRMMIAIGMASAALALAAAVFAYVFFGNPG